MVVSTLLCPANSCCKSSHRLLTVVKYFSKFASQVSFQRLELWRFLCESFSASGLNLQNVDGRSLMQSTFPRHVHADAHDWRQLLMFQGKTCSLRRAFTTSPNNSGIKSLRGLKLPMPNSQ